MKNGAATSKSGHGSGHWLILRITSIALLPLTIWFVVSVISLSKADHAQLLEFFKSPIHAGLMALLVAFSFYHAALGLQEVVEDYVHAKVTKSATLLVLNISLLLLGGLTLTAIIKMHLA